MSEKDIVDVLMKKLDNNNIEYRSEVWVNEMVADLIIDSKNIAIEAKLKDITKAMKQLITYKRKYENTFLYMPLSSKSIIDKHAKTLKALGIRWFYITDNNVLKFGHGSWRKMLLG